MKHILSLLLSVTCLMTIAQETLDGTILTKEGTQDLPLPGASIYWLGTQEGTTSDEEGKFNLPLQKSIDQLIISYIGFKTDTVQIQNKKKIIHFLIPSEAETLDEVTLTQRRKAIQKSYLEAQNIVNVNSAELLKAACCNLSESFETNPSIDVNFSDALTGTKQIKMLGLTSPYLLITEENIPMVRGASQAYGLTFTPGTWIESIQITKGTGSVANGF